MEEQVTNVERFPSSFYFYVDFGIGYILSKTSVEIFVNAQIYRDEVDEDFCPNSTDDGPEDFNLGFVSNFPTPNNHF